MLYYKFAVHTDYGQGRDCLYSNHTLLPAATKKIATYLQVDGLKYWHFWVVDNRDEKVVSPLFDATHLPA